MMQYFTSIYCTSIQNGSMGQGSGQQGGSARVAATVQQGAASRQGGFQQHDMGQMGHAMGQSSVAGGGHTGPMDPRTHQRPEMQRGTPPPVHHVDVQSSGCRGFGMASPVAFESDAFSSPPNAQCQVGGSPFAFPNAQMASVQQQKHRQVHQVRQVQFGSSSAVGGSAEMSYIQGGGM